jgi:tryptophanyl-tRNA synthetase
VNFPQLLKRFKMSNVEKELEEDVVTMENVEAKDNTGIDYDKLIVKFGSSAIDEKLVERIEKLTSKKIIFIKKKNLNHIVSSVEEYFFLTVS